MKKGMFFLLAVLGIFLAVNIQIAAAIPINAAEFQFEGNYTLTNLLGGDTFSETLGLSDSTRLTDMDPTDSFLHHVSFLPLILDVNNYTAQSTYSFLNDIVTDAFKGHNSAGEVLFSADLQLNSIVRTIDPFGNPGYSANFTSVMDIKPGVPTESPIAKAFISQGAGPIAVTLQFVSFEPELGGTQIGTYVGRASVPTPEPSTLLMLAFGILGLLGYVFREKQRFIGAIRR